MKDCRFCLNNKILKGDVIIDVIVSEKLKNILKIQ